MKILVRRMKEMLNTMKTRKEEKRRELHKERLARSFAMTIEERQKMKEKNATRRRKNYNRFLTLCFGVSVLLLAYFILGCIIPYWHTTSTYILQTKVIAGYCGALVCISASIGSLLYTK